MLERTMDALPGGQLDDVRRQIRLGMGPCQGGFCSQRSAGIAHERGDIDAPRANELLRLFLKNRWIGLWPILFGKQARQAALDNWIHEGTLDVEHLPTAPEAVPRECEYWDALEGEEENPTAGEEKEGHTHA